MYPDNPVVLGRGGRGRGGGSCLWVGEIFTFAVPHWSSSLHPYSRRSLLEELFILDDTMSDGEDRLAWRQRGFVNFVSSSRGGIVPVTAALRRPLSPT